jgi:hypothetical protein
MQDDLLENARRQAEKADASVRAAALLRIARADSAGNLARARRTLLEGLDAVQNLPPPGRDRLLEEARSVAAAVAPELLGEIPETHGIGPGHSPPFTLCRPCLPMVTWKPLSITSSSTMTPTLFHFSRSELCFTISIRAARNLPIGGCHSFATRWSCGGRVLLAVIRMTAISLSKSSGVTGRSFP